MKLTDEQKAVLREAARQGCVFSTQQLLATGVHPRVLYRLRDEGAIEQVSRGVFRIRLAAPPPHLDLVTVATRVKSGVVCLISALAFHDLTDEIPHEVMIAVPRGAARPTLDYPPLRVFTFTEHALGIESHTIGGVDVQIYDVARTVVDCFRFRNRIGEDVAINSLATALRTRKVRPAAIMEVAGAVRAQRVIAPYLKALS